MQYHKQGIHINKIIAQITKNPIKLNIFGKIFFITWEILKKIYLFPQIVFLIIGGFLILFLAYTLIQMLVYSIQTSETFPLQLIGASIGFIGGFIFLFYIFFGDTIKNIHKKFKETYLKIYTSFLDGIHQTKNPHTFIGIALMIPRNIHTHNTKIESNMYNHHELYIVFEKILSLVEKISRYQRFLPLFFDKNYIQNINILITQELIYLQEIINTAFQKQITHHKKIISDISHLQNTSEENYKDILELQKIRLEKQKEIFEKFLQK